MYITQILHIKTFATFASSALFFFFDQILSHIPDTVLCQVSYDTSVWISIKINIFLHNQNVIIKLNKINNNSLASSNIQTIIKFFDCFKSVFL